MRRGEEDHISLLSCTNNETGERLSALRSHMCTSCLLPMAVADQVIFLILSSLPLSPPLSPLHHNIHVNHPNGIYTSLSKIFIYLLQDAPATGINADYLPVRWTSAAIVYQRLHLLFHFGRRCSLESPEY